MEIVEQFKQNSQKIVLALKEDLKSIRTGRATPALIENVQVVAYGGSTTLRLRDIATITTEGSQMLIVVPFDTSTIGDIEKGILNSGTGLTPTTQGTRVMIKIPPLSQEQRDKFMKLANQKVEEKRVQIRGQRDEARRKIKSQFEAKTLAEDAKYRIEKDVDAASSELMKEVDAIKESKEREIREI